MTTKKHRHIEADLITTEQSVRSDYVLLQVTMTLAVETYVCDGHMELAHEVAINDVLERFETLTDEERLFENQIIVLHSDCTPLNLTKKVQS